MSSIIRFAVVGCGHIGLRHTEKITANDRAEVAALVDIRPKEEILKGKGYDEIPYFGSLETLLSSGVGFDIASICVPNGLHFPVAQKLLQAGKHVLIEKPMVLYPEQGEQLLRIAKENNCQIFGVLQNRYTPVCVWFKELLNTKRMGQIYSVDLECFWNRDDRYYRGDWHGDKEMDGGTLFTQYSHFLDLLLWFFGDAKVLSTHFANYNHAHSIDFEDSGVVQLSFTESNACGTLRYSTAVYGSNCGVRLSVLAEKGCVVLNGPFMNRVEHCVIEDYTLPQIMESEPGNHYGAYSGSAQNHHLVINNVVEALLGHLAEVVRCDDALKVVRFIRDIYKNNPYLKS